MGSNRAQSPHTQRSKIDPSFRYTDYGFRVVRNTRMIRL
jgi:hypothetical protein